MINKNPNFFISVLICCALFIFSSNLAANSLVKSVDADGNITYSDKPVNDAKLVTKVSIDPGPSSSEIDIAKQQAEKNINTADKIDQKNAAANKQIKRTKAPTKTNQKNEQPVIIPAPHNRSIYGTKQHNRPPAQNRPGLKPPAARQPVIRPRPVSGRH